MTRGGWAMEGEREMVHRYVSGSHYCCFLETPNLSNFSWFWSYCSAVDGIYWWSCTSWWCKWRRLLILGCIPCCKLKWIFTPGKKFHKYKSIQPYTLSSVLRLFGMSKAKTLTLLRCWKIGHTKPITRFFVHISDTVGIDELISLSNSSCIQIT